MRSGPGPIGAAARSLLTLAFGLAVVVSPLSMVSCPHHGAPSATSSTAQAQPHADTGSPHGASGSSDSRDHDHDAGPCCCLGHCCPGGSTAHPAADAADVRLTASVVAVVPAVGPTVRPADGPWLLPWPNGPPVLS